MDWAEHREVFEDELNAIYKRFDVDANGVLQRDEFASAMKPI